MEWLRRPSNGFGIRDRNRPKGLMYSRVQCCLRRPTTYDQDRRPFAAEMVRFICFASAAAITKVLRGFAERNSRAIKGHLIVRGCGIDN
jgi:uroporphyrinogen-III synthase